MRDHLFVFFITTRKFFFKKKKINNFTKSIKKVCRWELTNTQQKKTKKNDEKSEE